MGQHEQLFCSLDTDGGPGMGGAGPHGIQSYRPTQPATDQPGSQMCQADDGRTHLNLLGWNGTASAPGPFPGEGAGMNPHAEPCAQIEEETRSCR
jgi:nitrate reductase beta subunit